MGVNIMICKECQAEINGVVCQNCGYKNKSKSKKYIITAIITVVLITVIAFSIFLVVRANENKIKKICVSEGQAFCELVNKSQSNMYGIGVLYSASTKINHGYGWDEEYFTNYATQLNSTDISEEKTNRVNIETQFEIIQSIESDSDEIKNFQKQTENLYNAYENMYDLLIEQNFTYKNFETKYSQIKNELDMALELYNSVLEELNGDK